MKVLHDFFEFHNSSFIGRNKYLSIFICICDKTEKDLSKLERKDIDIIVTKANQNYKSLESKKDFIKRQNSLLLLKAKGTKQKPTKTVLKLLNKNIYPWLP